MAEPCLRFAVRQLSGDRATEGRALGDGPGAQSLDEVVAWGRGYLVLDAIAEPVDLRLLVNRLNASHR
jgi:hypothetical protein